jgi:diaminopimelate decarboxylase
MNFTFRKNHLFCEGLRVKDIQEQIQHSPFYLYSAQQIRDNYDAYIAALGEIPAVVSYAVKANGNLGILALLRDLGSWATLVSGNELRLVLAAGFDPGGILFNGNGKTLSELRFAIENQVMVNIDSEFDLEHIHQVSDELGVPVSVLLRVNPDIDPEVHPYVSTGLRTSKFGIRGERVPWFLKQLKGMPSLNLVGIHCHLGSMIDRIEVYRQAMGLMADYFEMAREDGFPVKYLNIGGGLGIDYSRESETFPDPGDFVDSVGDLLPRDATLIIEPGRSIVGNAGILVCRVIGVKRGDARNFIVTDGSMAELLRPSLYQAVHQIGFIEPVDGDRKVFDIVGPVCESADVLGVNRELPTPREGVGVVVYDTGAYGYAMSSNYNARMRPPEYLVDGERLIQIRQAERFEEYLKLFEVNGKSSKSLSPL